MVDIGADSWGLEVVPAEDPTQAFPVHPELLAKNGVYILENMDTRALVADQVWEFLFVLGQPKFVGAVQAVKVTTAESHVIKHFHTLNETRRKAALKDRLFNELLHSVFWNAYNLGTGAILLLAAQAMQSGSFT